MLLSNGSSCGKGERGKEGCQNPIGWEDRRRLWPQGSTPLIKDGIPSRVTTHWIELHLEGNFLSLLHPGLGSCLPLFAGWGCPSIFLISQPFQSISDPLSSSSRVNFRVVSQLTMDYLHRVAQCPCTTLNFLHLSLSWNIISLNEHPANLLSSTPFNQPHFCLISGKLHQHIITTVLSWHLFASQSSKKSLTKPHKLLNLQGVVIAGWLSHLNFSSCEMWTSSAIQYQNWWLQKELVTNHEI